jgi:glycosyltransferase involved in cell wall biosynthesis
MIVDTLDHFAQWCDGGIIVYDDCSTDNTVELAMKHPAVKQRREDGVIVQHEPWSTDRTREEWRHRQILLEAGRVRNPEWFIYFDCDERLLSDPIPADADADASHFRLFDAYITEADAALDYRHRTMYGPEYRDIVFAFRNLPQMRYFMPDQRIVCGWKHSVLAGDCQHFGKAKSPEEWESTCAYYMKWFPEPYKTKWAARRGRAVHTLSDFGRPLVTWDKRDEMAVCIGRLPAWR